MKGKLIKTDVNYLLEDDKGVVIASTSTKEGINGLTKQNCDEIFGAVDVDKLAEDFAKYHSIYPTAQDDTEYGFKNGFNKAIEINKDKVFTLSDMKRAFNCGRDLESIDRFEDWRTFTHFINSLQPTEIEVEIKTEPCFYDQSLGGFSTSYTEDKPKEQPKLDSDGCLILKKL
jgi:hypothetical protein